MHLTESNKGRDQEKRTPNYPWTIQNPSIQPANTIVWVCVSVLLYYRSLYNTTNSGCTHILFLLAVYADEWDVGVLSFSLLFYQRIFKITDGLPYFGVDPLFVQLWPALLCNINFLIAQLHFEMLMIALLKTYPPYTFHSTGLAYRSLRSPFPSVDWVRTYCFPMPAHWWRTRAKAKKNYWQGWCSFLCL